MDEEKLKRRIRKMFNDSKRRGTPFDINDIRKAILKHAEIFQVVLALTSMLKKRFFNSKAAYALGEIAKANPGDVTVIEEAVPSLIDALKDSNSLVQYQAAIALGKIAETNPGNAEIVRMIPALNENLECGNEAVRRGAVIALGKIGKSALALVNKEYLEGRIRYEDFEKFYFVLKDIMESEGFDKGTVAPPKKKPDNLGRKIFSKPAMKPERAHRSIRFVY